MPYWFSRSSVKFQGHTGQKIADFDPSVSYDCPSHASASEATLKDMGIITQGRTTTKSNDMRPIIPVPIGHNSWVILYNWATHFIAQCCYMLLNLLSSDMWKKNLLWFNLNFCRYILLIFKSVTNFPLPGTRKKGRPWKTWSECVKTDVDRCGLVGIDPLDRDAWKAGVWHSLVLPTPYNGTRTAPWYKMDIDGLMELLWICSGMDANIFELTLAHVMAWCHQATSHYLSQCWFRCMLQSNPVISRAVNSRKSVSRAYTLDPKF